MRVKWYNIYGLAQTRFRRVTKSPGIYFVRFTKNEAPVPVGRLGGVDHKGILYVGSATNLRTRIRRLWRAINENKTDHTIGKTIIFCKVFETINLHDYEVSWEELKDVNEARGQEGAALKEYCDKYKEPPPLNLEIKREYYAIVGLWIVGKSRIGYEADDFVKSVIFSKPYMEKGECDRGTLTG